MQIKDLTPDPENANKGTPRGESALEESISSYGLGRSILIDKNNRIIAGNKTAQKAGELGIEQVTVVETTGNQVVAVKRTDLDLDEDNEARELAYADNRTSELSLDWDPEQLLKDSDRGINLPFTDDELKGLLDEVGEPGSGVKTEKLADRFLVPPFSVLDARQGYWQDRKRGWIDFGIESELGRGGEDASAYKSQKRLNALSPGGSPRPATQLKDGKTVRGDGSGKTLGAIAGNQETLLSPDYKKGRGLLGISQQARSNYAKAFGPEGNASEQSGTSIFDPVLCELAYRWFCGPNGKVLDPFAGGSVRGIIAAYLGREYTGIDLSGKQIEANRKQWDEIGKGTAPKWIEGDSREVCQLAPDEYDFVFTCPPYADLEVYSDDPKDISTLEYKEFLEAYGQIISESVSMLKDDRFAMVVVGDLRDKQGIYRNFVSHTVALFQEAGAMLYNDAILVTSLGSLPIRAGKGFVGSRKLGKTHQNVLVFVKGNPGGATDAVGEVEVADALDKYGEEF